MKNISSKNALKKINALIAKENASISKAYEKQREILEANRSAYKSLPTPSNAFQEMLSESKSLQKQLDIMLQEGRDIYSRLLRKDISPNKRAASSTLRIAGPVSHSYRVRGQRILASVQIVLFP